MKIKSVLNKSFALLLAIVMILSSIAVLAPAYATVKTFKCSNCHGLGSLLCNACSGSGKLAYYDVWVHKYLYTSCPKCLGAGRVTCSWCDGYGFYSIDVPDPDTSTPPKTSISKVISREAGFSVSWKAQTNKTTGYQIQYATNNKFSGGKAKTVNGKTNITITGLTQGKKYYIRVRTYREGSDKNYYSAWSAAKSVVTKKIARPAKTAISKFVSREGGFSVSWKKQTKNTTAYQIQYATNNKFSGGKTKSVKGQTNTTVMNLAAGKRYYVRVRTYRTFGGKNYFSAWSAAKSVVTKNVARPPKTSISKIISREAGFSVSWQNKNVSAYQIQYATNSKFKNAKTKSIKGRTNTTVLNLIAGKRYYIRVRTFKTYKGRNYFSAWSPARAVVTKGVTAPKATVITSVTREAYYGDRSPSAKIYFRKVTGCTGYQLQTSTYSNFKTDRNTKTYTCSHNNNDGTYYSNKQWCWWFTYSDYGEISNELDYNPLKCDTTYYFRIRTYKKANGKTYYSKWSKAESGYWKEPTW